PVCGQDLPQDLDEHTLHAKMRRLVAPEITKEAKRLAEREAASLRQRLESEHQQRLRKVERDEAEAKRKMKREVEGSKRIAEQEAKQSVAHRGQVQLERIQADRERDRERHNREKDQWRRKFEEMQRKLDTQTSEQLGNQAEVNLLAELKAAFPADRIDPVS